MHSQNVQEINLTFYNETEIENMNVCISELEITSPACLAIVFTWSGSLAPRTPVKTAAKIFCLDFKKERRTKIPNRVLIICAN